MVVIKNESKSVKVLKAVGVPALRLFPGFNYVDVKNPKAYVEGNAAAGSLFKEKILVVQGAEGLDAAEKKEAQRAKDKNDDLNKAQRIIKGKDKEIKKGKGINAEQASLIEKMAAQNAELLKRIEALEAPPETEEPKKDK